MFNTLVKFEENRLSDTVIEFKIVNKSIFGTIYFIYLFVLIIAATVGLLFGVVAFQLTSCVGLLGSIFIMRLIVIEESIIVIKNFGIQLRVKYLLGSELSKFLDKDRVDGILLHEYIYGSQIRYSIAFLVKGQDRMSLLFKNLYPGFDGLKRVYKNCQQSL